MAAHPRAPDELARTARSEATLRARGVKVLDSLPVIAGETRSLRRTDRAVAERRPGAMIAAVKRKPATATWGRRCCSGPARRAT
ncbi:hypothetical protein [Paracoccus sp. S1E-3]|uniref:hypothetical protein n=1 Tax=Paracoccus sp. S1E-3 TaxID=2756130 RepID=UPI0015EEBDAA|nr:hypothetical protein [Paracoccus sp. S1E-3]MBA4492019.1 hypothetical protein [Paracoccus sp. S1E-3]